MPASSLIFVVIIAVWAAYLLQHWIRRRDHVATAKSVDRFSEAMRVLERRQALGRLDLSRPAPRSYAVSPLRPARPDVVVKRADRRRPAAPRRGRAPRAVALLLAVVVSVAAVLLGAGPLLPWWVAAASPVVLLLAVALLRATAPRADARPGPAPSRAARSRPAPPRADPASRTAAPRRAAPAHRPAATTPAVAEPRAARRVVREADPLPPRRSRPAAERRAHEGPTGPAPAPRLYDVEQVERAITPAPAERAEVTPAPSTQPAASGTWQPVPVPRPTYLMKAPARRPVHGAARHTPVDELPFDGHALALEEEFEELPAVHG